MKTLLLPLMLTGLLASAGAVLAAGDPGGSSSSATERKDPVKAYLMVGNVAKAREHLGQLDKLAARSTPT
jgi:hypothetical protein